MMILWTLGVIGLKLGGIKKKKKQLKNSHVLAASFFN